MTGSMNGFRIRIFGEAFVAYSPQIFERLSKYTQNFLIFKTYKPGQLTRLRLSPIGH